MSDLETLLSNPETAGVWNLIPDRSSIGFKNRTLWGLMNVKGKFTEFSGDGQITGKGAVFGRLDIRAGSVSTGIRKRDEHLRSPDFFDVERFPDISVVVTGVQHSTGDTADLRATLTVKGITLPLTLPSTVRALDDGSVRITVQTTVDRAKFDVTGNQLGMLGKTTTLAADALFARA